MGDVSAEAEKLAEEIAERVHALPRADTRTLRELRREYSRLLKDASPSLIITLGPALVGKSIHRFFGDELIANHPAAGSSLGPEEVLALGAGISSWDQVDSYALYIAGPAWRRGQISDDLVLSWTASPDRWWRRAALVSTVALNSKARGGTGDAARTLLVCNRLVRDRDDMVVKALSWSLRALAAVEPAAVRGFLEAHRAQLAARVVRETESKLASGRKNRKPGQQSTD
jgi:3-methyladenine DNA glycosylase AlkD